MYNVDQFLLAGAVATLFWLVTAVFLQNKIIIFTHIAGKHAFRVYVVFLAVVYLQLLVLTILNYQSRWMFTSSFWILGDLIFTASLMLVAGALYESGPGILVATEVFGHRKPRKGKLWRRYKQPLAIGVAGVYIGLGFLTGHIVYLITSVVLGLGIWLVSWVQRRILK